MADTVYLNLLAKSITTCQKCPLHTSRTHAVPGHGNPEAGAVLVAEKPGKHEDLSGKPMQGPAGQQLDEVLRVVGLSRRDFWLTNVVKCKPAYGQQVTMQHLTACHPYLESQLAALDPDLIVLAGTYAVSDWFPGEKIGSIHGKPRSVVQPWETDKPTPLIVVPVYHPAAILREGGVPFQSVVEDFQVVARLLYDIRTQRGQVAA